FCCWLCLYVHRQQLHSFPTRRSSDLNQPLSKDEAVDLLNTVLNQNGFAAVRKERTLTIMSRKDAKTEDIPVRRGSEPKDIQKNEDRKSTRLNSSHGSISYAVFCLKKK